MVLGLILNEFFDLGINIVKISYNGTKILYKWVSNVNVQTVDISTEKIISDMKTLNSRLEKIELELELQLHSRLQAQKDLKQQ